MLTALAATAGGVPLILAIMLGLLVGIALPPKAVSILIQKRISRFTAIFPDTTDLLVRGLRSGLTISTRLVIVSRTLTDQVGTEFRPITARLRIGRPPNQPLQATADRLTTPPSSPSTTPLP